MFFGMTAQEGSDLNAHSLCKLEEHAASPIDYAQKTVTLNGQADTDNPFFNNAIEHLALMEGVNNGLNDTIRPVVVTKNQPHLVHVAGNKGKMLEVLSATINDADLTTPALTSGIIGIAASNQFIFAAAKPNGSNTFGDLGSGIGYVELGVIAAKTEEPTSNTDAQKILIFFRQLDAPTGLSLESTLTRSLPFDRTTPALLLAGQDATNNLTALGQKPVLHWDEKLSRLFIGVSTCSGQDATAGTRSIAVAYPQKGIGLNIAPIAPDSAFNNTTNCPVGVRGACTYASIHKLAVMHTSTALSYLIVLGDIGIPEQTCRSVYALPLVNSPDAATHGTLAAIDAQPEDVFDDKNKFERRLLTHAATTPDQLPSSHDAAVLIGGKTLESGTITTIVSSGDSVYITVADDKTNKNNFSGIFCSRAIFEASGKIKGWTCWQRATIATEPAIGLIANHDTGLFTILSHENSENTDIQQGMRKTEWKQETKEEHHNLASLITTEFATTPGGIVHAQDFPYATKGLAGQSLFIATGVEKVVVAQTGTKNGPYDQPQKFNLQTDALSTISGGQLTTIGAITSCAIATDNNQSWLIVGGSFGATILTSPDNSGWAVKNAADKNFSAIIAGFTFKKFGDYRAVKKIIADDSYLYILTDHQLDRLAINATAFNNGTPDATTITDTSMHKCERFLDIIVSGKCALLATNKHLLRTANGHDVRAAQQADNGWVRVEIPESVGPVISFECITTSALTTDFARGIGSTIHLLNANYATNESQLVRFAVEGLGEHDAITDATICPLADVFKKGSSSSLICFDTFRNVLATDGARYLLGNSGNNKSPCELRILAGVPTVRSGQRLLGKRFKNVLLFFTPTASLNALGTISASGSLFAAGSFGMRIHE